METETPKIGIPFYMWESDMWEYEGLSWLVYRTDEERWKELCVTQGTKSEIRNNSGGVTDNIHKIANHFNWTYDIPDKYKEYIPVLCNAVEIARWKIKSQK